ncbi:hypothetical protein BDV98DRAFT_92592 [Pterulicium gracile]|uniref:Uncharacterized protein n=1 Tax=Pterulicium gracile TaxID=1884261 RepID=A0A5C3QF74_9AGAR|nr:hypothetical protein BDV98DRAFT_92592 [Pterula gracilis]
MAAPPGPQSYIIIPAADQSSEFEPSMSWKISQKEEIERNSEQMRVQAQDSMEEKLRASVVTKQQREDLENEYKAFVRSIRATAQSQFYAVLSEERQTLQILGVSQLRISDEFIKEQQSILATIQQKKDQEGNIHDTDDAELVPIPDVATPASIPSSSWSAPHILPSRPYPPPVHSQERARVSSSTSTSSRQALDLSSPPSSSGRGYNDYSGEAAAPLRARPSLSRQSTDTAQSMPPPQTPPALSSSADSPLSGTPPVGTRSSSANWTTYTRPNAASASSSDKSASIRKDGERNEYSNHSDNASPSRRTSVVIGNSGDTSSWRGSMSEREPTSRRPSLLEREAPQLSSSPKQRAEFWKPSVTRDEDAALSKPHATPRRNSTASTRSIGSSHSYKPPSVGPIRTQANPEEDSAFEAEVTVNPIEEEPALYIGKGKGVDRGPAPRAVSAQSSRGDPTGSHLTQYFTRHQTQTHSDPYDRRADSRMILPLVLEPSAERTTTVQGAARATGTSTETLESAMGNGYKRDVPVDILYPRSTRFLRHRTMLTTVSLVVYP